jgi:hypothetical protein
MSAMSLSLRTRYELTYGGVSMLVPKNLIQRHEGKDFFKVVTSHQGTIKLLAKTENINKNSTLAGAPGLQKLKEARNIASGLVSGPSLSPIAAAFMAGAEDSSRPPKFRRKVIQAPWVSIEVPGFEPVVLKKATSVDECLLIEMTLENLQHGFSVLCADGLELGVKRHYNKSGKYSKKHRPDDQNSDQSEHFDTDGEDDGEDMGGDASEDLSGEEEGDAEGEEEGEPNELNE